MEIESGRKIQGSAELTTFFAIKLFEPGNVAAEFLGIPRHPMTFTENVQVRA
jgi:hypothetical protein